MRGALAFEVLDGLWYDKLVAFLAIVAWLLDAAADFILGVLEGPLFATNCI